MAWMFGMCRSHFDSECLGHRYKDVKIVWCDLFIVAFQNLTSFWPSVPRKQRTCPTYPLRVRTSGAKYKKTMQTKLYLHYRNYLVLSYAYWLLWNQSWNIWFSVIWKWVRLDDWMCSQMGWLWSPNISNSDSYFDVINGYSTMGITTIFSF